METTLVRAEEVAWERWGRNFGEACDYFVVSGLKPEDSFLLSFGLATIDVPECAFSHFPGMERLHYLLSGETELAVQGVRHQLLDANPFVRFPGDVQTSCKVIRGPVSAFNVIASAKSVEITSPVVHTNQKVLIKHETNARRHAFDFFLVISGELRLEEITHGENLFRRGKMSIGDGLIFCSKCESDVAEITVNSEAKLLHTTAFLNL